MGDSSTWSQRGVVAREATRQIERRPDIEVWGAGGVIHRVTETGPEVLLIHRPRHDDWSFPKGKLDPGETLKECALREVEEETGLRCLPGTKLPPVEYRDARQRHKAVVYWTMTVIDGSFTPNDEVDIMAWFDLESATGCLTYRHDRELLDRIDRRILCPRVTR